MFNGVLWESELSGKLEGFKSISTSSAKNPICCERAKDENSICSKCYAMAMLAYRHNLDEHLTDNLEILTDRVLEERELPFINSLKYRLEFCGDVANECQVINYFNICNHNPNTTFAVWTKNASIYKKAIQNGYSKPKNLIIVYSSPYLNVVADVSEFDFIDIVFTVFTAVYAIENNITINCGGIRCLACMECYTQKDGIRYVNEMLKSQQKKYYKMLSESNK